jgi:multidrug efflux system membrane fusion protein
MVRSFYRHRNRTPALGIPGITLVAVVLAGCSGKGSVATAAKAVDAVPVMVAPVVEKAVPMNLYAIGNVDAYVTVAVKAQVDGQIVRVHFKQGQDVAKGALLFELDPRPFEDELRQAQANVVRDEAQHQNALAQARRYGQLLQKQYVSREQYDQIQANLQVAEATVKADEAVVAHARLQLDYTKIRSPVNGRTGKIMIQEGNLVKANDTNPLVVINQIKPVYVTFAVPEHFLDAVREYLRKDTARVSIVRSKTAEAIISGRLVFVDNAVNTTTGTITLRAEFQNADEVLWPGEFVNVKLTLYEQENALVVPADAVQTGPKGQYVFVVKSDMTAEMRDVVVERTEGSDSVIANGVSPGEQVIVNGQSRLVPGARVSIQSAG